MEGRQLSDTGSQVSGQPSVASISQPTEGFTPPAAICMEALLALNQELKLSSTGLKADRRPPPQLR